MFIAYSLSLSQPRKLSGDIFKRMTKSECRSSKERPNDEADRDAASSSLVFWASFVIRASAFMTCRS